MCVMYDEFRIEENGPSFFMQGKSSQEREQKARDFLEYYALPTENLPSERQRAEEKQKTKKRKNGTLTMRAADVGSPKPGNRSQRRKHDIQTDDR